MSKAEIPLVSICTTFSNSAGRYIHRVLDSCLTQTYQNIEIVTLDNATVDGSEKVIREYAARDSRVKYFRTEKIAVLTERLCKMFELAQGRYVIFLGADDWLARDFIENGVRSFTRNPDAAGIVPGLINLLEVSPDRFQVISEFGFLSGVYSSGWFVERLYKSTVGVAGALALVRREDAVGHMDYFLKYHCEDRTIPEELSELYTKKAYAFDNVFFLDILTKYKNFVWDNSLLYMKITHLTNVSFESLKQGSLSGVFKNYYYTFLSYKTPYQLHWSKFYWRMKIWMGMEALGTAFIYFLRRGFRCTLEGGSEDTKLIREFFHNFSIFEIAAVLLLFVPRIVYRFFDWAIRRLSKKNNSKNDASRIFTSKYFLDQEGRFAV